MSIKGNKEEEYIIYEIVSAKTFSEAEKLAKSNDINPEISKLNDFLDGYMDDFRESILEEEGQQQEDQRNDLD